MVGTVSASFQADLGLLCDSLSCEQAVTRLCDDYVNGVQSDPWSPDELDREYAELKDRAKVNVIRLPPAVLASVSKLQGYRRVTSWTSEGEALESERFPQEFKDWRRLRLGRVQHSLYQASATYGQSFVEVFVQDDGLPGAQVLSSLNTTAVWDNPVSDEFPRSVFTLVREAIDEGGGLAYGWDSVFKYRLVTNDSNEWVVAERVEHGLPSTPIVRFPCFLDTEGRVSGIVENLIEPQDRINQSVLDLLTGQAYTGNQVYTIAGVRGEKVLNTDGTPVVDENGNEVFRPFRMGARRVMTSDSENTKFDRIPAGSLTDLLSALASALELFAVAGQQSPYLFSGKITNLSSEALAALDSQFFRLVKFLHSQWGEAWASVFRLFAFINGDLAGFEAWDVETRWEDFSIKTFSAYADGLSKVADSLQIPAEGLWHMIPGVSSSTVEYWKSLREVAPGLSFDDSSPEDSFLSEARAPSGSAVRDSEGLLDRV